MENNKMDFSFDVIESQLLNENSGGVEIDYDPDFLELESIVTPKAEQQYGDTIIPAAPIDWSRALSKACDLLGKSKDFRLCCIITRALTNKYGIKGTLKGIEAIGLIVDNYWDSSYPEIYFDGEVDFLPRANAISEINSFSGLVGELRLTELTLGSAGKVSLGKIERILSGRAEGEDFSRDQLLNIFRDESNNNADIAALNKLQLKIIALEKNLISLFGNDQSPDFTQLKQLIINANPILGRPKGTEVSALHDNTPSQLSENTYDITHKHLNARIQSRTDAIALLDKVCEFLSENDPANPAPLLIKRARNMIGQDFYSILNQLAPDAVSQAEQITGSQN